MRALLHLTLFAGFVLLSGALPVRAESTRSASVACATLEVEAREARQAVAMAATEHPFPPAQAEASPGAARPTPRVASVPRFLLHRALLN